MNVEHLTDEQFAMLLSGKRGDAQAQAHVESCAVCRAELQSVGSAIADLNSASLRWAERRAARIGTPSVWALNWRALPGWGATVAGVLIVGVALGAHMQSSDRHAVPLQPAHVMTAPSDDELAQDNRLLRSIDAEVNEQPQLPAAEISATSRPAHRHGMAEVSN